MSRICGAGYQRGGSCRERERERTPKTYRGVLKSLAKCWACLDKKTTSHEKKNPKISGRAIAGDLTLLGRVSVPIRQSEKSTQASGRVLRRVLPQ